MARYGSGTGAQTAGTLEFSTYLGGKGTDYASGIAVYTNAATGVLTAYVLVLRPTTLGAVSGASAEPSVTVANGIGVLLGRPGTDVIYGLAVGTSGNARVTGLTNSTTGIATPGTFQNHEWWWLRRVPQRDPNHPIVSRLT